MFLGQRGRGSCVQGLPLKGASSRHPFIIHAKGQLVRSGFPIPRLCVTPARGETGDTGLYRKKKLLTRGEDNP